MLGGCEGYGCSVWYCYYFDADVYDCFVLDCVDYVVSAEKGGCTSTV